FQVFFVTFSYKCKKEASSDASPLCYASVIQFTLLSFRCSASQYSLCSMFSLNSWKYRNRYCSKHRTLRVQRCLKQERKLRSHRGPAGLHGPTPISLHFHAA